jgi:hypothetical protein
MDEADWAEMVSGLLWNYCEQQGWKDVVGLDIGEVIILTGDGKKVTLSVEVSDAEEDDDA